MFKHYFSILTLIYMLFNKANIDPAIKISVTRYWYLRKKNIDIFFSSLTKINPQFWPSQLRNCTIKIEFSIGNVHRDTHM